MLGRNVKEILSASASKWMLGIAMTLSALTAMGQHDLGTITVHGIRRSGGGSECGGAGAAVYSGGTFLGCYNISGTSGLVININGGGGNNYYRSTTSTPISERDPTEKCGVGNPIMPSTGSKIEREVDFETSGEMPLMLERAYNSYWQGVGLFGKHWVSSFDYKLTFGTVEVNACYPRPGGSACGIGSNTVIYAWRPGGAVIKYVKNATDGIFYEDKPSPVANIVVQSDGSFVLHAEDLRTENYSSAGYVTSIRNEQGIGWTFAYSGTYPQRVIHTSGRVVEFFWTNGQLTSVRDPAGNHYGYSYAPNAFGTGIHRLNAMSKPGTPSETVTYHYHDSSSYKSPYLAGKSYSGVRYSTFGYDSRGYAKSTEHNGKDKYTFTYTEGTGGLLTVAQTNPLGKKTTYVYKYGQVQSITGHPSTYCPDTTYALTEYDANGNPTMKSDFNGNNTAYSYNAKGQLTQMIEGYGTPQARTTQYAWDPSRNRMLSTTVPGANRLTFSYRPDGRIANVTETNLSTNGVLNQTRITSYDYAFHANGMLASIIVDGPVAGNGDAMTTSYNVLGDVVSVTNSLGHAMLYSNHTGLGQPGRVTGANGDITDYIYDAQGRIVTERRWFSGVASDASYSYNAQGLLTTTTAPDGVVTHYEYDNARRLIRIWRAGNGMISGDALREERMLTYDAMGNVTRIEDRKVSAGYESRCVQWTQTAGRPGMHPMGANSGGGGNRHLCRLVGLR